MNIKAVQEIVSSITGVDIKSSHRTREIVYARSVYFKILRDLTPMSLTAIGKTLNKNHATVVHSLNKTFNDIEMYEPKYLKAYEIAKSESALAIIGDKDRLNLDALKRFEDYILDHNCELYLENKKLKSDLEGVDKLIVKSGVLDMVGRVPEKNMDEFLVKLNNLSNYMAKQ